MYREQEGRAMENINNKGGIYFNHVKKSYDKKTVVEDFELRVEDGEFLVLLGPSGCGKSTMLRVLAGLEEIDSGKIFIGDKEVTDLDPKDRDIAMVFQNYALYPHMSVYKNIATPLVFRKTPKDEIDRRVREVAEMLELSDYLDRKPKKLSGGQMQRVALARAMIRNPKAFLMDEPLSNLDSKLRVQTRAEIMKLYKRLGVTTIFVTHDQVEAMTMATRIVIMNKGHIEQIGKPDELYNKPKNLFVADFIGSPQMNFIDASMEISSLGMEMKNSDIDVKDILGADKNIIGEVFINMMRNKYSVKDFSIEGYEEVFKASDTDNLVVGIRPEHISIVQGSGFTVELVENLGSEKLVYLKSNDGSNIELRTRVSALDELNSGMKCDVELDPKYFHIFDKKSGSRICG